ncbi:MAG: tetratricopeptide repeat protein [Rhodospirillales bacterium]|nr:tetratricopeptide repeat protein [Rhodospirillales bacterium]
MAKKETPEKDDFTTKVESTIGALIIGNKENALENATYVISKYPDRAEGYFVLGILAFQQGEMENALDLFNTAHQIDPDAREYVDSLSVVYTQKGNLAEGLFFAKLSTALEPNTWLENLLPDELSNYFHSLTQVQPSAHYVNAMGAFSARNFQAAAAECEKELAYNRGHADACRLLAKSSFELGNFPKAAEAIKGAIATAPDVAENYIVLGDALMHLGEFSEAIEAYRVALSRDTKSLETATAAFYGSRFLDDKLITVQSKFLEEIIRRSGIETEDMDPTLARTSPPGQRKPRIGYISNSLFESELGTRIQTLLSFHNMATFDVYLYQMSTAQDSVNVDVTHHTTSTREIYNLEDDVVAMIIENDQIDVLVDLCGYSESNRLGVMVQSTAPVKMGFLNYPYGLNVPRCNYILSDTVTAKADQKALGEGQKQLVLDYGLVALRTFSAMQDVQDLPAKKNRYITFGGICDLARITPALAKTWIKILDAVPESKILLGKVPMISETVRVRIKKIFPQHSDRIDFMEARDSPVERLDFYHQIDILLDSSPVSGEFSACEAMWMGVPVMTLKGKRRTALMGASILFSAGKPEWVFSSEKKMIEAIVSLTKDRKILAKIRGSLRDDISNSALYNPRVLVDTMEKAYMEALNRTRA